MEFETKYEIGCPVYMITRKSEKYIEPFLSCEGTGKIAVPQTKTGHIECPSCRGKKGEEATRHGKFFVKKPTRVIGIDISYPDPYVINKNDKRVRIEYEIPNTDKKYSHIKKHVNLEHDPSIPTEPAYVFNYGFTTEEDALKFAEACDAAEEARKEASKSLDDKTIAKKLSTMLGEMDSEDFYGGQNVVDYYDLEGESMYWIYRQNNHLIIDAIRKITNGAWTYEECTQRSKKIFNLSMGWDEDAID